MSLIIFILTSLLLILSIIFFPKIKKIDTYYIIALLGAILMIIFRQISFKEVYYSLFKNELIQPIKILILFFSMTFISIILDTVGFFNYIASKTLKFSKGGQFKLFTILYIIISILTIFTSNDVVILTFTPFICYFTKRAKINSIPYLIAEFIAANTASMMFLIGNPTNIILSFSNNITFFEYLKVMFLPTIIVTIFLYILLIIIFKKPLSLKIEDIENNNIKINKTICIIGLIHLSLATILLVISNYINLEMYLITLIIALSLLICILIYNIITKKELKTIPISIKRLPYGLIPFLLSMFILVSAININGYTLKISNILNKYNNVFSYGISSFLCCNLMNNIPMSVLYSNILQYSSNMKAIYASIIGSNLGAYLTPLGALAGIMWISIIKSFEIEMKFTTFIKYGAIFSISALLISLGVLYII